MKPSVPDVDWGVWSPEYERIVQALALDPEADRRATGLLHSAFANGKEQIEILLQRSFRMLERRPVTIFGCGPSLGRYVEMLRTPIGQTRAPLIAADGSTSALLDAGILPDIIVTDLDGDVPRIIDASKQGSIVFLHAHGDNTAPVAFHLELLQNVVPITQTEPTEIVRNFGGFTDGDKCVFLANAFGVSRMLLVGMEFGQVVGSWSGPKERKRSSQRKLLKLRIGRRLVENQVERSGIPTYCLGVPAIKGVEELREDQILSFMGRDDWRS